MARLFADENLPFPVVEAGIIVCSFDLDFDGQAARIDAAISTHASIGRRLVRVNRPGIADPYERADPSRRDG